MKEEALKKSEQMLEEDAIRFDTFLKENDKKAQRRSRRPSETKLRPTRCRRSRSSSRSRWCSPTCRSTRRRRDCLKYKDFLDYAPRRVRRGEAAHQAREPGEAPPVSHVKRRQAYEAECKRIGDEWEARQAASWPRQGQEEAQAYEPVPQRPKTAEPKYELEPPSSARSCPCTTPQQLLDIFTALEGRTLLIQNSQETEQAPRSSQTFNETGAWRRGRGRAGGRVKGAESTGRSYARA